MYIRCADCYACSRIWSLNQNRVVCGHCGREYTVSVERPEEVSLEAISKFALSNGIDAPLAGSVLLGFMSIERAREIRDNKQKPAKESVSRASDEALPLKEEPRPVRRPTSSPLEAEYDPDFEKAVARGHLTAWGARQRGDREALIKRLSDKYEIPRRLAAMVADNQVNLRAAIAAASAAQRPPETAKLPAPSRQTWLIAALALALVVALGWGLEGRRTASDLAANAPVFEPAPPPQPPPREITERLLASTDFRADESGELVEIVGPDPRSVLLTYCDRGPRGNRLEPLRIESLVPATGVARLGIFRDLDSPALSYSITIRRDRRTGRWMVGDGDGPIPTSVAPEIPTDLSRRNS